MLENLPSLMLSLPDAEPADLDFGQNIAILEVREGAR